MQPPRDLACSIPGCESQCKSVDAMHAHLKMFHEHCNHDVDKNELRDEHEDDEKHWRQYGRHAAVGGAIGTMIAFLA